MARPPVIKAPDQIVTLGDKIRCALYLRRMGYNELDRAMGREQGYTSRLIRGLRRPQPEAIAEVAKALRVREEFFTRDHVSDSLQDVVAFRALLDRLQKERGEAAADALIAVATGRLFDPDDTNIMPTLLHPDLRGIAHLDFIATFYLHIFLGAKKTNAGDAIADVYETADAFLKFKQIAPDFILTRVEVHEFNQFAFRTRRTFGVPKGEVTSPARLLAHLPEWVPAATAAMKLYPSIPRQFFVVAGWAPALPDTPIDAQLIGELARSYYDLTMRHAANSS